LDRPYKKSNKIIALHINLSKPYKNQSRLIFSKNPQKKYDYNLSDEDEQENKERKLIFTTFKLALWFFRGDYEF